MAAPATHLALSDLGIEILDPGPDPARARIEVTPAVCQPFGIVHGGTYAALAETVCSLATYEAVKDEGMVAMGQSNQASFLRPVSDGHRHRRGAPAPPGPHHLDLGLRAHRRRRVASARWCG